LSRRSVSNVRGTHIREYEKGISVQIQGEASGGQVLVYHGSGPTKGAIRFAEYGHPAATGTDHQEMLIDKTLDGISLDYLYRLGAWHNSSPASACILAHNEATFNA